MQLKYSMICLALSTAFSMSVNAGSLVFDDGQNHSDDKDLTVVLSGPTDNDRFAINAKGENTNVSLTGENISVKLDGQGTSVSTVAGIRAEAIKDKNGAILTIGSKDTEIITVDVVGKNAVGIWAYNPQTELEKQTNDGGQITLNGKNLILKVKKL